MDFFSGRDDLTLLTIDTSRIKGILVYEDLYDAGEDFPHVYGPLPTATVVKAEPFSVP